MSHHSENKRQPEPLEIPESILVEEGKKCACECKKPKEEC